MEYLLFAVMYIIMEKKIAHPRQSIIKLNWQQNEHSWFIVMKTQYRV